MYGVRCLSLCSVFCSLKDHWEVSGESELLNGKYELITTTVFHEEIGSYVGYGIRYGQHTVTDISVDRAKIEILIELMNSNELSPLHMMDIIEDFLAEDSDFFSCN